LLSHKIISLVFDKRYEEAESLLSAERDKSQKGAAPQLEVLSELLHEKIESIGQDDASMRRILARVYMVADVLVNQEYWADAEIALDKVIELSLAKNEPFFLTDSQFKRAICLKALGRADDLARAKSELPKGTVIMMRHRDWRVDDL
jgi:hypothetical protein